MRRTQGDLQKTIEAGVFEDGADFVRDSLFCEWGYVANLDDSYLEVYRGFQRSAHDQGRYASLPPKGEYFPIGLLGSVDFGLILSDKKQAMISCLSLPVAKMTKKTLHDASRTPRHPCIALLASVADGSGDRSQPAAIQAV